MKIKTTACLLLLLLIFNCQKNISVNSSVKNPTKKTDTVKVNYYPSKILKEVDLKQFEGDKNVRLNCSETGILLQKTVHYGSYPTINYEYNANKKIIHQYEQGDIGGCIATKGKDFFWDDSGLLSRKIIHSNFGKTCDAYIPHLLYQNLMKPC